MILFLAGVAVGSFASVFLLALCRAAARGDELNRE